MTHGLKILKEYADRVLSGEKRFEVRWDDRHFQAGDDVLYTVVDDKTREPAGHPLDGSRWIVTYVQHGLGLRRGFCAFGIEEYGKGGAE